MCNVEHLPTKKANRTDIYIEVCYVSRKHNSRMYFYVDRRLYVHNRINKPM